jgi:AcrR family transcriptional regulator
LSDKVRTRRPPDEARRLILSAAEELLVVHGPAGVSVRAVAERVGMTDAGVHHHFGSRDGLLEALLRHGGRRLREELKAVTERWLQDDTRVQPLVAVIAAFYQRGYSQLALALVAAGWRDKGSGMLQPVVDALHAERIRRAKGAAPDLDDTRLAVAAMHPALAVDPSYGAGFRRSAGFTGSAATDPSTHVMWWVRALSAMLDLPV